MSYRNPQQVVDTQSGKAFTDLQRTISGVFTGVADTYKKEQDEQAKKQQELADARKKQQAGYELQEARVYQGLAKANWSNKALDIKGVLGPLVNSYSDIMDQINSGAVTDPKTIASYRAQAADILTMPGRIGNIIEGMEIVSENIKDTVERMGSLGGMDPGSPGTMYEDMHVFMNQSPGQRLLSVKPDESGSLQGYITIKRNGKTTEYSEKQINAFISGKSNGISIIPDETSDMEGLTKSFVTMTDPLNANKTIYQDSAFLPPVTERRGDKMVTYKPVNRDLLINQAGPIISANLKAMSLDEKVAFGNNIASPSNRIFTLENVNTEDSKKILKDGYANYWLEKFAIKEQVLSSEKVQEPRPAKEGLIETGKDFYDKVRKNPISYLKAYTNANPEYDRAKNTITIKAGDLQDADEDKVYNMNNPDERISFYTRLLEYSQAAKGNSKADKLMRKQFEEALRAGTAKKLKPKAKKKLPTD